MTQNARVLRYIAEHPDCTTMSLIHGLSPFVSNPRARISDLRARGHRIVATKGRYRLITSPAQLSIDGSERLLA